MAGYCGFSKSNNAIDAENQGMMTASVLARQLKVSTAAVKEFCSPREWHHTSSWYNSTNYYYEPEILAAAGLPVDEEFDAEDITEAKEKLEKMKKLDKGWSGLYVCQSCGKKYLHSYKHDMNCACGAVLIEEYKEASGKKTYKNCKVTWLEWSGSRKHPKATEMTAENCTVETNGITASITLPTGKKFTKRENTRGFSYTKKEKEND